MPESGPFVVSLLASLSNREPSPFDRLRTNAVGGQGADPPEAD